MKLSFLFLFITAGLLNGCTFNCESYLKTNIEPLVISGVVVSKQKAETGCFGIIILKNHNKTDTLKDICYCMPESQGLWKYVAPGDSIYKSSGSLVVEVFREKVTTKFDYPCCSR